MTTSNSILSAVCTNKKSSFMMKQNLNEAAVAGPARGGFDSDKTCSALEPEWHEDQTCAYVAQMQSTSRTQNVASTAPLQCTLASSVFHSDLHKLLGFQHFHPACFQDLAQTAARSSERLPSRTLLHLAPLQLFAYPICFDSLDRREWVRRTPHEQAARTPRSRKWSWKTQG